MCAQSASRLAGLSYASEALAGTVGPAAAPNLLSSSVEKARLVLTAVTGP